MPPTTDMFPPVLRFFHAENGPCSTFHLQSPHANNEGKKIPLSLGTHRHTHTLHALWTTRLNHERFVYLLRAALSHLEAQRLKCARAVASPFLRRATACFSRPSTSRDKLRSTCGSPASTRGVAEMSARAGPRIYPIKYLLIAGGRQIRRFRDWRYS